MKVHYFQRYHEKENVATANTMLLLSRLYSYSPDKFFRMLKLEPFSLGFKPELEFTLQARSAESVLDATITQEGFKLAVETKMSDWFYADQLMRHLKTFKDTKNNILLTIAPEPMDAKKKADFEEMLFRYNEEHHPYSIRHVNTTFEALTEAIREVIEDRDYEMKDILDDYLDYCIKDGLITVSDSWKFMRMQLAGTTLEFNAENDVYYDNVERRFRAHDYLGLYKSKSVRLIGKICAQIVAVETEEGLCCEAEIGDVTEKRKEKILYAMKDAERYGYDLHTVKHRYFFVEKFYETDFRKISPKASMGTRIFDLSQILNKDKDAMDAMSTEMIAKLLEKETWV